MGDEVFSQHAFINIDQVFVQNDRKYADFNVTFKSTKDGTGTIINSALSYFVELLAEVTKVNIYAQTDELDYQYSKLVLETKIETCNKSSKAHRANVITSMLVDFLFNSVDVDYSCPLKKGFKRTITNRVITDNLLPAFNVEQKFKVKSRVFSKIREKKGYINTFNYTIYGRIKK